MKELSIALLFAGGYEAPLPSIRRTSTDKTRGLGAGAKWSARGSCFKTVTACAARSVSSASSPQPVTTTSCMLNTPHGVRCPIRVQGLRPRQHRRCASAAPQRNPAPLASRPARGHRPVRKQAPARNGKSLLH
jgi:hypothetical protein